MTIDWWPSEQTISDCLDQGARLYTQAPYLGMKIFILWPRVPPREIHGPAVSQMINDGRLLMEPYTDSNLEVSRYLWIVRPEATNE